MDTSVKPSEDFFQYANGTWIKNNPIPPEFTRWGSFNELAEKNNDALHEIAEKAAKEAENARNQEKPEQPGAADVQKVGDYYASGMDEKAIDAARVKPLEDEFKRIDGLKDKADVLKEIAHLHLKGVNAFFNFGSGQDEKNSTMIETPIPEARRQLLAGEMDAAFFMAPPESPFIRELFDDPSLRAMDMRDAEGMRRNLPFLHALDLPRGTWRRRRAAWLEHVTDGQPRRPLGVRGQCRDHAMHERKEHRLERQIVALQVERGRPHQHSAITNASFHECCRAIVEARDDLRVFRGGHGAVRIKTRAREITAARGAEHELF